MASWHWVPSMYVAGEIPAAIVTYVAILMLWQSGQPWHVATAVASALFLPWTLRGWLGNLLARVGFLRTQLLVCEFLTVGALAATGRWLMPCLVALSCLALWHREALDAYFASSVHPLRAHFFARVGAVVSQITIVFTYGMMLMLVGSLQVIYRRIPQAWSEACVFVAGLVLILFIYHAVTLKGCAVRQPYRAETPTWGNYWLSLVLFLPQSLMFFTRVIFLLMPRVEGGLGCTIHEVAFAQGAVGVIAFSFGMFVNRSYGLRGLVPVLSLGLSPVVYLVMSHWPPAYLWQLCACTFTAQFLFGLGVPPHRHMRAMMVAMMVPAAFSGWLALRLGFQHFFALNVLTAPLMWVTIYILHANRRLP